MTPTEQSGTHQIAPASQGNTINAETTQNTGLLKRDCPSPTGLCSSSDHQRHAIVTRLKCRMLRLIPHWDHFVRHVDLTQSLGPGTLETSVPTRSIAGRPRSRPAEHLRRRMRPPRNFHSAYVRSGGRAVERWTAAENHLPRFRNLGNFVHLTLPVSFGRDTKSRWSLLSGVYARGSKKIPHRG